MHAPDVTTPFTVIGGFLGAGKTTLLNHILSNNNGTRFAVLVNDFGKINIDQSLIKAHDGQTMSLSNGCICCSLADGFINTMLQLMQQRDQFDHIVVEASGVSEPARIMDFARLDPELQPDAIIVLADASTLMTRLDDAQTGNIVKAQIQAADLLLLNKTDLVATESLPSLQQSLQSLGGDATVLQTRHADLPLSVLLGTGLAVRPEPDTSLKISGDNDPADNELSENELAEHLFTSITLAAATPLDRDEFMQFTQNLDSRVIRGKGFVVFSDQPQQTWQWQYVAGRSSLDKSANTATSPDTQESMFVLISTGPLIDNLPHHYRQLIQ